MSWKLAPQKNSEVLVSPFHALAVVCWSVSFSKTVISFSKSPPPSPPTASHTNPFALHSHPSSVAHQRHWWAWPWCWQECAAWTLASALLPLPAHGGLKHLSVLNSEKSGQKDETSLLHSLPLQNSVKDKKNLLILPLSEAAEAVPQQGKGRHKSRSIKINDCYRTGGFWPAHELLCYWQGPNFLLIFVRVQYQVDMCAILKQCVAFSMPTSALLPTRGNTATVFQAGCLNWDLWTHWSWLNPQKQQSNKRSHSRPSGICLGVQTIPCLSLV